MAEYYDSRTESWQTIPKAAFYVCSNDPFFSNSGKFAGKTNTCVVACDSWEEAEGVRDYIESRGDQKYIRINISPPRNKRHVVYSMPRWKQTARAKGYLN